MEAFYHTIQEIGRNNGERTYKVSVRIPISLGFIENVQFVIHESVPVNVELEYERKDSVYAYFTGEVTLPEFAVYKYSFEYMAEYQKHTTAQGKLTVGLSQLDNFKGTVLYQTMPELFKTLEELIFSYTNGQAMSMDGAEEFIKRYLFIHTFWVSDFAKRYVKESSWVCKQSVGMQEYVQYLADIGKDNQFLRYADVAILNLNPDLFAFERTGDNQRVIVLFNRSGSSLDVSSYSAKMRVLAEYDYDELSSLLLPHGAVALA